ncbi:MAG: hypothetical protein ABI347_01025 [Nitrososphaera sp.]|jgi:LmbE family N-acetylglucosaminyl deacetylase
MKILAIGTRPGEVELGCGGCLINSHLENEQIFVYVLSDSGWHKKGRRYSESLGAAWRLMAPTSLWVDNFSEDDLLTSSRVLDNLKFFIRLVEPDVVLCPSPNDSSLQRRKVASRVIEASDSQYNVLAYEQPDTGGFRPQAYYDISDVLANKLDLCNAFSAEEGSRTSAAGALARRRAVEFGMESFAAEAFEIISYHISKNFGVENIVSKFPAPPAEKSAPQNNCIIEYASIISPLRGNAGA